MSLTAAVSGLAPRVEVTAPPLRPLKYGLMSVASVQESSDHVGFGFEYEAQACGTVASMPAACDTGWRVSQGTASVSVGTTRNATLTTSGAPTNEGGVIDWGDGSTSTWNAGTVSGTHTYTANGTYQVRLSGYQGYSAGPLAVTVTNGSATGPFAGAGTDTYTKTDVDGVPWVTGEPFALYAMQKCRTVYAFPGAEARVRTLFDAGETRGVEKAFATILDASTASSNQGGATALDPILALAKMEQYARDVYMGAPTLHMSAQMALVLGNRMALHVEGDHLETTLGSPVAVYKEAAAVIPQGASAVSGAEWLWATGSVVVQRGGQVTVSTAPDLNNEFRAIAERMYGVSWECFAVAAPASLTIF